MSDVDQRLNKLFHPNSVAFVGASNKPGKWGFMVLSNLINGGFPGSIYPINPGEEEIQGLKAFARVTDVPGIPDLAVIVVPPPSVPLVIQECVAKGIKAGIVITAGFAEVDGDGERLQREMVELARAGGMILVGPNCNGIMRPPSKLYVAMPPIFPPRGPIGVVSQSGNVATSIARRGMKKGFGCSCFVSSGNEADLHCEDYFDYLAEDPETKVILSYIEGFRDGKRFFETAKRVTKKKPLIMLKAGGTTAGAKAAKSHTAALSGSDLAFDGACWQNGVIRAKNIDDLCNIGVGLMGQPLPQGKRVAILTGGGGWGVLAADACIEVGLDVVTLSEKIIHELDDFLPAWWSRSNPVDLVAGLRADHLWKALEILLGSQEIDGVIVLGIMPALSLRPPPPSASPNVIKDRINELLQMIPDIFRKFMELAHQYQKPVVIASELPFPTGELESRMAHLLGDGGYVCYTRPEDAAMVMINLVNYARYLRSASY